MKRPGPIAAILIFPFTFLVTQHAIAAEGAGAPVLASIVRNGDSLLDFPDVESDPGDDDQVMRLFDLYMDARIAGTTQEADVLAKQIVEVSIRSYGRDSKGTARALTNLASLQVSNDENTAAIQNLSAAIDIIESVENNLSLDLISPLTAMGSAQQQAGNAELAQLSWNRAVHISHVNLGPHNYQQIETLYSLSRLLIEAGENKAANKMRRRIAYLQSRDPAQSDLDTLPGALP